MSFSDTIKRAWNDNRLMSVLLELTYACNLDCSFCYNDLSLSGQRLSLSQYRELLDDLASLGVLNLTLTGGEPLAHPHFFEIATHARSLGFVIRIKTNGHAVRGTVARRIREEVDPFLVEVSVHGATAATHDRQTRVPGSFQRLVANIRTMKSLGLRVKANSVLTRWNEDEIEDLLALYDELDVAFQIDPEVKPRDDGDRTTLAIEASAEGQARYRRALAAHAKRTSQSPRRPRLPQPARPSWRVPTSTAAPARTTSPSIPMEGSFPACSGAFRWATCTNSASPRSGPRPARSTTSGKRPKPHGESSKGFGDAGLVLNFCPGAAHTYSGDPLAIYPPAEQRMVVSGRARVRLTVV